MYHSIHPTNQPHVTDNFPLFGKIICMDIFGIKQALIIGMC